MVKSTGGFATVWLRIPQNCGIRINKNIFACDGDDENNRRNSK